MYKKKKKYDFILLQFISVVRVIFVLSMHIVKRTAIYIFIYTYGYSYSSYIYVTTADRTRIVRHPAGQEYQHTVTILQKFVMTDAR